MINIFKINNMKHNYLDKSKRLAVLLLILFIGIQSYSQDIHFNFENPQITNDGSDDFYEADIMIQTINSTGSFKMGSGQLYFTYNTAAFGENVSSSFEVLHPEAEGYICGQFVDAGAAGIYGTFTINDNTTARVSWSFSQTFSSATFASNNVTDTLTKLCHLKMKYLDVNEQPQVAFETGAIYLDLFFTACGPGTGTAFEPAACGTNPGTQIFNDTFDSTNASLSVEDLELLSGLLVYPNPATDILNISSQLELKKVVIFNLLGKQVVETTATSQIDVSHLSAGIYLLNVYSENAKAIKKLIVE
jgi:hypothetical protein